MVIKGNRYKRESQRECQSNKHVQDNLIMCGRESQTFYVRQFLKREGWGGVSFYRHSRLWSAIHDPLPTTEACDPRTVTPTRDPPK